MSFSLEAIAPFCRYLHGNVCPGTLDRRKRKNAPAAAELWEERKRMGALRHLLLSDGFLPHGYCYLWTPGLVELHVISDALIALSYLTIPVTLVYFIRKRRDIPFSWMLLCFGGFIVACGTTHLMEIYTIWFPPYWFSGAFKGFTACVSVATAIRLSRIMPQVLALRGTGWL